MLRVMSQKGDTIVEVLIAIAIASVVLTGGYTVANRSSVDIRAAQERSEALKQATAAIETIKSNANADAQTAPFCPDASLTNALATLPAIGSSGDKDAAYATQCKQLLGAVTYVTVIERDPATSVFRVHTRWDRVGGGSRQEVVMIYKRGLL